MKALSILVGTAICTMIGISASANSYKVCVDKSFPNNNPASYANILNLAVHKQTGNDSAKLIPIMSGQTISLVNTVILSDDVTIKDQADGHNLTSTEKSDLAKTLATTERYYIHGSLAVAVEDSCFKLQAGANQKVMFSLTSDTPTCTNTVSCTERNLRIDREFEYIVAAVKSEQVAKAYNSTAAISTRAYPSAAK